MAVTSEKSVAGPRALRRSGVVAIAAVMALLVTGCLNADQTKAVNALNASRATAGAPKLNTHQQAQAKAQAWANKLARDNRLSHSKLTDGISGCWRNLGENVGYGGSIQAVQNQFMASSGHRNNVVSRTWNGVGVGVAKNGNRVFVVQVFIKAC